MAQLEKIIIRKATFDDLSEMLRIMDEELETPTIDDEMEERVQRWLIKLNDHLQFIFYVAEIDHGELIGWCRGGQTIEAHSIVSHQKYDCEIHNIFIRQPYQHRGIGRELWKIVWNEILLLFHPKNVVVWSVYKEQAQNFYLSLGGVVDERKKFDEDCVLTAFAWDDLPCRLFFSYCGVTPRNE